jgi:hypothetical protein
MSRRPARLSPENAEHDLRRAYNRVVDAAALHFWDRRSVPGVNAHEAITLYKQALNLYRQGRRLSAERWARAARHLSAAFLAEGKIAFLEPHMADLPCLKGATAEEFDLGEHSDTTTDLLNSIESHAVPGFKEMPEEMKRYLVRARKHLDALASERPEAQHELLRAERIKAAYEYGRVLECLSLAYETEHVPKKPAA